MTTEADQLSNIIMDASFMITQPKEARRKSKSRLIGGVRARDCSGGGGPCAGAEEEVGQRALGGHFGAQNHGKIMTNRRFDGCQEPKMGFMGGFWAQDGRSAVVEEVIPPITIKALVHLFLYAIHQAIGRSRPNLSSISWLRKLSPSGTAPTRCPCASSPA